MDRLSFLLYGGLPRLREHKLETLRRRELERIGPTSDLEALKLLPIV